MPFNSSDNTWEKPLMRVSEQEQQTPTQTATKAALEFLKKCYEIGNKKVWKQQTAREKALARKAKARNMIQERKEKSPDSIFLCGEITLQYGSKYCIEDKYFEVNPDTWIIGTLRVGSIAEVYGKVKPNTDIVAKKLVILK